MRIKTQYLRARYTLLLVKQLVARSGQVRTKIGTVLLASILVLSGVYWRPRLLLVSSGSMEPTLSPGSLALIVRTHSYQLGDVVTFAAPEDGAALVTHRISEIISRPSTRTYHTKGDANKQSDARTVQESQILGEMVWHWSGAWLHAVLRVLSPEVQAVAETPLHRVTLASQFQESEKSHGGSKPERVTIAEPFLLTGECRDKSSQNASRIIEIGQLGELLPRVSFSYTSDLPGIDGISAPALEITVDDQTAFVLSAAHLSQQPQMAWIPINRSGPVILRFTARNPLCVYQTTIRISNLVVDNTPASATVSISDLQTIDEGQGQLLISFSLAPHERVGEVISYEVLITNQRTNNTEVRIPRYHDRDNSSFYLISGREELVVADVPPGEYIVQLRVRDHLGMVTEYDQVHVEIHY